MTYKAVTLEKEKYETINQHVHTMKNTTVI